MSMDGPATGESLYQQWLQSKLATMRERYTYNMYLQDFGKTSDAARQPGAPDKRFAFHRRLYQPNVVAIFDTKRKSSPETQHMWEYSCTRSVCSRQVTMQKGLRTQTRVTARACRICSGIQSCLGQCYLLIADLLCQYLPTSIAPVGTAAYEQHKQIFVRNVQRICEHNDSKRHSYIMGLNNFTDMSEEEMKQYRGLRK